jgi:inner membrane protein
MATIYTHAFAGVGLASLLTPRPQRLAYWLLAGFLPVLPDFDSFSYAAYGSLSGHRGFTHSLAFALAVGLLTAGVTFRYLHVRFWPLFGLFFLVTASHGVLDAFTNGGFGIPFLWPFTDHRWGPYGPINVSDIAFELPDPRTSRAVRTELLYVWLPLGVAVVLTEGYRWLRRRPEHPARMR